MKEYKYNYKRIAVRLDEETFKEMEFLLKNTTMNFSKFIRESIKEKAKEIKNKVE
jgi:predicted DNA-binding protein